MIETTFLATSEKLCGAGAPPTEHLRRAAQFVRHCSSAKKRLDRRAALLGARDRPRGLAALPPDGQRRGWPRRSRVSQRRQPLVPHQHQEAVLGQIGGASAGSKPDGPFSMA